MPRPPARRPRKEPTFLSVRVWLDRQTRKRRRRKGDEGEREPVEPPDPTPLSGGAAAELEFDD